MSVSFLVVSGLLVATLFLWHLDRRSAEAERSRLINALLSEDYIGFAARQKASSQPVGVTKKDNTPPQPKPERLPPVKPFGL